jgi:hypothetical protein
MIFIDFFDIDTERMGVRITTDGLIFNLTMQMFVVQGNKIHLDSDFIVFISSHVFS